jgi:hypothetical protein
MDISFLLKIIILKEDFAVKVVVSTVLTAMIKKREKSKNNLWLENYIQNVINLFPIFVENNFHEIITR